MAKFKTFTQANGVLYINPEHVSAVYQVNPGTNTWAKTAITTSGDDAYWVRESIEDVLRLLEDSD